MAKTNAALTRDTSTALGQSAALLMAMTAIIQTLKPEAARYVGAILKQAHEGVIANALATPSASDRLIEAQGEAVQLLLAALEEQAARS